jgi:hypothetical protein
MAQHAQFRFGQLEPPAVGKRCNHQRGSTGFQRRFCPWSSLLELMRSVDGVALLCSLPWLAMRVLAHGLFSSFIRAGSGHDGGVT